MNPKPMTNDSDRVAPDRRIHLPSPTPGRPRRRIAAGVLSVLLGLSCFAASPAWAVKLGEEADDTHSPPEFANVARYLAVPSGDRQGYIDVKIGEYTLKRRDLEAFHKANTLTDTNLIKRHSNAAAYIAEQARANQRNRPYLYAYLEDLKNVYRVTELEEARRNTPPGGSIDLPDPVEETPGKNTAIGDGASATEYRATAIGVNARATDRGAVAIGLLSRASGWKSIAIGAEANANGGIAMGRNAQAREGGIALGRFANADGGVSLGNGATTINGTAVGSYSRATAAGAAALGSSSRATTSTSTALGSSSWATGLYGSTAVGGASRATGERSTALGAAAKAGGLRSTVVGQDSQAHGDYTVAVGRSAVAGGSGGSGLKVGNTYDDVAAYLADKTRTGSTIHVRIGNKVYKVTALDAVSGLTKDNLPASLTVTTGGVAVGVSAVAAGMNSIALGREASATGTDGIALGRGASATGTKGIAIGPGVSAGQNEVVIGADTHTYELPGLGKHASGTRVVTVDSEGRLSTQAAASSPSRSASLRGAAALSSETTSLNRDMETRTDAADYEEAPAIGSGPTAPETADRRRVVVQDTNRDGSVRLRTLDFSDLSGMDRRLDGVEQRMTSLSDRLNKATAMSAALSALPNVVPGDNRFFLGVGAGHYSSEQALAIGMSARVGRHVFVNAGAALASGDDASVRGGVGVVW